MQFVPFIVNLRKHRQETQNVCSQREQFTLLAKFDFDSYFDEGTTAEDLTTCCVCKYMCK